VGAVRGGQGGYQGKVYKAHHGDITGEALADDVVYPSVLQHIEKFLPQDRAGVIIRAEAVPQVPGKPAAHPIQNRPVGAVVVLHLMSQGDAHTCDPVPSVAVVPHEIRRAAYDDLPAGCEALQPVAHLYGVHHPVLIQQKAEIAAEQRYHGLGIQKDPEPLE